MDILKQIANFQKQNDGMLLSLKGKNINIEFDIHVDDDLSYDEKLEKYKTINLQLKELSKLNRPPPPPKDVKPKEENVPLKKPKNEEEDEEEIKEVKPVYSTITNMETIKREFFNKEYINFQESMKQHPFKMYKAKYKYSSDNDGRPEFVARNLLRGFVQGLDDYRKYLLVCFRCILIDVENKHYDYPSYWIVNSNDDLSIILGSLYDDYEFSMVESDESKMNMMLEMEKKEDDECVIGESYLH
jgi:hypothetical protein